MPNKKGGKKFKKNKKQVFENKMIYKDSKENEIYGRVTRKLGNGRFTINCFDGKERLGVVAGSLRKKLWINNDDIVIVSLWEFTTNSDKCSIVHKYELDQVKKLIQENEIPEMNDLEMFNVEDNDYIPFDISNIDDNSDDDDNNELNEDNNNNNDYINDISEEIDLDEI